MKPKLPVPDGYIVGQDSLGRWIATRGLDSPEAPASGWVDTRYQAILWAMKDKAARESARRSDEVRK